MDNFIFTTPVMELGRLLISQLEGDGDSDLTARWMAYYLAERLQSAACLPQGPERLQEEKYCHDLILNLWAHRQEFPRGHRPLKNFDALIKLLEQLHPDSQQDFYIETYLDGLPVSQRTRGNRAAPPMEAWRTAALTLDKTARHCIWAIIKEMSRLAEDEKTKEWIASASKLEDKNEAHIVNIITEDDAVEVANDDQQSAAGLRFRQSQIETRLKELAEFSSIHERIVQLYTDQLAALKAGQ